MHKSWSFSDLRYLTRQINKAMFVLWTNFLYSESLFHCTLICYLQVQLLITKLSSCCRHFICAVTNNDGMPLCVTIAMMTVIRVGVTCHCDVYSHCVPVRDNMIMPHMGGNHLTVAMHAIPVYSFVVP